MFAIQSIMLVSLGFLLAVLLAFVVAPAYWKRAARLTGERLRRSLPMSEAEIRADKDRLRAHHAIRIHKLETRIEAARLAVARQKVEINRRDATISELERTVSDLNTNIEASENARRVLEQTIMDRVPRVEKRLSEVRDLLAQRDLEMAALQAETNKTFRALHEAMQINQQQRVEIDRLQSSLATRQTRISMERSNHASYEGDVGLRSELETLRARTGEQASLISKLQTLLRDNIDGSDKKVAKQRTVLDAGLRQLDEGMQSAQNILTSVAENGSDAVAENAKIMRELKSKIASQNSEIEKLRAALKVFEEGETAQKSFSMRDTRIALKARIASLEKETAGQVDTIRQLRAELASTNDRSARQAAQHMNELRRLGSGAFPTAISARQRGDAHISGQAEQSNRQLSLVERITEKVPDDGSDLAHTPRSYPNQARSEDLLSNTSPAMQESAKQVSLHEVIDIDANEQSAQDSLMSVDVGNLSGDDQASNQRGRLVDRIVRIGKE